MFAKVTIYDDNGSFKGPYDLEPSRIYDGTLTTKYVFEFEYCHLKDDIIREVKE